MPDTTQTDRDDPRSSVFDGYTLTAPDLLDVGEAEKEFEIACIVRGRVAAMGQHPDAAERILSAAIDKVSGSHYAWGTRGFDDEALKAQHLPFWIWLELRHKHPEVTREQAGKMLREHPDPARVQDAVIGLAGYPFTPTATRPPTAPPAEPPGPTPPTTTGEGPPAPPNAA
jgi:hypothetical protein